MVEVSSRHIIFDGAVLDFHGPVCDDHGIVEMQ